MPILQFTGIKFTTNEYRFMEVYLFNDERLTSSVLKSFFDNSEAKQKYEEAVNGRKKKEPSVSPLKPIAARTPTPMKRSRAQSERIEWS